MARRRRSLAQDVSEWGALAGPQFSGVVHSTRRIADELRKALSTPNRPDDAPGLCRLESDRFQIALRAQGDQGAMITLAGLYHMLGRFALNVSDVLNAHVLQRAAARRGHGDGQSRRSQSEGRPDAPPVEPAMGTTEATGAASELAAEENVHQAKTAPGPEAIPTSPRPGQSTDEANDNVQEDVERVHLMQGDMVLVDPRPAVVDGVQNGLSLSRRPSASPIPCLRTLGSIRTSSRFSKRPSRYVQGETLAARYQLYVRLPASSTVDSLR